MVGKMIEFEVISNGYPVNRRAKVTSVKRHEQLGDVYTATTPFGNEVRLTMREIKRVLKSK